VLGHILRRRIFSNWETSTTINHNSRKNPGDQLILLTTKSDCVASGYQEELGEESMERFIAVAGNIGVGKSTLVALLSEKLGWTPFFEPVTENPYLADFYEDMPAWGFHSQIYFLMRRLRIHRKLMDAPGSVIQDRSVYEDAEIFAHNLYLQDAINDRDYGTYRELYQVLVEFLPPPDLVIYLRASVPTLLERIAKRDRTYERTISADYLADLNELYETWVEDFALCPVLTVPCDNLDYVAKPQHLTLIVEKVEDMLMGKEEVRFDI
jgi:deoxyadenosine/deoxycytidine kinase